MPFTKHRYLDLGVLVSCKHHEMRVAMLRLEVKAIKMNLVGTIKERIKKLMN